MCCSLQAQRDLVVFWYSRVCKAITSARKYTTIIHISIGGIIHKVAKGLM